MLEHIAKEYETVRKGVKSVMGGKILDYEAKTIRNQGREEGWKRGHEEGREEGINTTVSVLKKLGIPVQTILAKIQEKYGLSLEASHKYVDQ